MDCLTYRSGSYQVNTMESPSDQGGLGEQEHPVNISETLEIVTAPHKSRSMSAVPPASFREKMDTRLRQRRYLATFTQTAAASWVLTKKVDRDRILAELGHPLPQKFLESGNLADVARIVDAGGDLVIKPVKGSASRGVFVLRQVGGGYLDLRTERLWRRSELLRALREVRVKDKPVKWWSAEQLVLGDANASGHPMDYKFYMFQDLCGLILQKAHLIEDVAFRWYDASWSPVETGKYASRIDEALAPPEEPSELVDVARRVACSLPLPFVRVDLLQGRDGVYVSEVSPLPGRYHRFNKEMDRLLGTMWEIGEMELASRLSGDVLARARDVFRRVAGVDEVYPN